MLYSKHPVYFWPRKTKGSPPAVIFKNITKSFWLDPLKNYCWAGAVWFFWPKIDRVPGEGYDTPWCRTKHQVPLVSKHAKTDLRNLRISRCLKEESSTGDLATVTSGSWEETARYNGHKAARTPFRVSLWYQTLFRDQKWYFENFRIALAQHQTTSGRKNGRLSALAVQLSAHLHLCNQFDQRHLWYQTLCTVHAIHSAEAMSLKDKKHNHSSHIGIKGELKWRKRSLSFAKYPPNSLLSIDFPPASSPAFPSGTSQLLLSLASNLTQLTQLAPFHLPRPTAAFWLTTTKRQSTDYL